MPNMSYCRFENTAKDLQNCLEAMQEQSLAQWRDEASEYEANARKRLIKIAIEIADEYRNETE